MSTQSTPTKIISIIKSDGTNATATQVWNQPNALLFEIVDGPHTGKRGPDSALFDLVGPLHWDKSQVSIYETGQILPVWMLQDSKQ